MSGCSELHCMYTYRALAVLHHATMRSAAPAIGDEAAAASALVRCSPYRPLPGVDTASAVAATSSAEPTVVAIAIWNRDRDRVRDDGTMAAHPAGSPDGGENQRWPSAMSSAMPCHAVRLICFPETTAAADASSITYRILKWPYLHSP